MEKEVVKCADKLFTMHLTTAKNLLTVGRRFEKVKIMLKIVAIMGSSLHARIRIRISSGPCPCHSHVHGMFAKMGVIKLVVREKRSQSSTFGYSQKGLKRSFPSKKTFLFTF